MTSSNMTSSNMTSSNLPAIQSSAFDYSGMDHVVADRLQQAANRIRDRRQAAVVDIGRELNAIKKDLPHGQFGSWLQAEFGWSHSTANNFMRVATHIGDRFAIVANLPPTIIYKLAAAPEHVRENVFNTNPGNHINQQSIVGQIKAAKAREEKAKRRGKSMLSAEDEKKRQREVLRQTRAIAQFDAEKKAKKLVAEEAAKVVRDALGLHFPAFQDRIRATDCFVLFHALLEPRDLMIGDEPVQPVGLFTKIAQTQATL